MKGREAGSIGNLLQCARVIPDLTGLLDAKHTCWLVGGALRNFRLGLPVDDFDFALAADPTNLARRFASRIGGHWFFLDETRRQSRVVAKTEQGNVSYDFSPWRAATLEADLKLRDYTINAMALPLKRGDRHLREPFDPLDGAADLAAGVLRCCSETVLQDDPLRVLKGVRHCQSLDLYPDRDTLERMSAAVAALPQAAPERIHAELGQIFAGDSSSRCCELSSCLDLASALFGSTGASGSFAAACETLKQVEKWTRCLIDFDRRGCLNAFFDETIEESWSRRALLKLAAFLCGYELQDVDALARDRLRLGRRATALLKGLADLPVERYREFARLPTSKRGRALWVESLGPGRGEALVLLSALAGADPAMEGVRVAELLSVYLKAVEGRDRIADLVSGDWVREALGVVDGPRIGELLKELRDAEIEGWVSDAAGARRFLRQRVAK